MRRCLFPAVGFWIVLGSTVPAADYFVSLEGNDEQAGTRDQPFRTLERATQVLQPGDRCYLRAGRYETSSSIDGLKGLPAERGVRRQPVRIMIAACEGEDVILDGTEPLLLDGTWEPYLGNVYRARLKKDVWQLFVDDKMVMHARWPDGQLADRSIWEPEAYAVPDDDREASHSLKHPALARFSESLAGVFYCFERDVMRVAKHEVGSDTIHMPQEIRKGEWGKYYLEGLPFLDAPNEWWYDHVTKVIYVRMPDGRSPEGRSLRGKVRDYVLQVQDSSQLHFKDLTFFGGTFAMHNSTDLLVEDCTLLYPSCNKRMLGVGYVERDATLGVHLFCAPTIITVDSADDFQEPTVTTGNIIRNCEFAYADGTALLMYGKGDLIENSYFHDFDWSNCMKFGICLKLGWSGTFRRNTVHNCNTYAAVCPGVDYDVAFNDCYEGSKLIYESTLIHAMIPNQKDTTIHHNWTHDAYTGIRFDTPNNGKQGRDGVVHHNVMWNSNRIIIKGDFQKVANNTVFDNQEGYNDLILMNTPWGDNLHSMIFNNAADQLSGQRREFVTSGESVPGLVWNNWNGLDYEPRRRVRDLLRDPDNRDFRPRPESILADRGIGAYEAGHKSYWIPGRKLPRPSMPIPSDGSTTATRDTELIWLEAYRAQEHEVYFGTDPEAVAAAGMDAPEYRGRQAHNIYTPGELEAGRDYHWRVDALGDRGGVARGDVWTFQTED